MWKLFCVKIATMWGFHWERRNYLLTVKFVNCCYNSFPKFIIKINCNNKYPFTCKKKKKKILTGILRLVLLSNLWRISLMLSLVSGWVTCRAGSIMQTSLPSYTQFELCSFPSWSFDTSLTKEKIPTTRFCLTFVLVNLNLRN